ncbi:alpha/beta fold hydrolase [Umezawaea tangerina]|uniref:Pimeloyl-ACP methyl ester carboxylesterase n=1 Tax=Umezawaea tangerina TaxID=84725 RepID=A0A2T0SQQ4_9PSEU|nr:alpha/beta hydrolase [Umezawaea tangerina]PRY35739.1 pimeloyl-ACP methyl ester carboxylesterase [Umezawaea tangerina]
MTDVLVLHDDLALTVTETGEGRPFLVLHGGSGPDSMTPVVEHYASTHHVLAPVHPGWDDTPRPDWFSGVDDLATTYLDLLEDRGLADVVVLGCSFGGWVAAEMAVRDRARRIGHLVLVDAVGPEVPGIAVRVPGGRPPGAGGPPGGGPPGGGPSAAAMAAVRAYGGPTMSDPKLLRRLARVHTPTLVVWGEDDLVVSPDFGRAYAAAFPDARFELIPGAGHVPTREEPEATLAAIDTFLTAETP